MPLGYTLTQEQKELVHDHFWCDEIKFNVVSDINGVWYLPDFLDDTPLIGQSEYSWILNLPIEFHNPPPPPSIV